MAVGYFVRGVCYPTATVGSNLCSSLYPFASFGTTSFTSRSCSGATGSGPSFVTVETQCVNTTCSAASTSYSLMPCDTLDAYSGPLQIFAAFVVAMAIVWKMRRVIRWMSDDHTRSE